MKNEKDLGTRVGDTQYDPPSAEPLATAGHTEPVPTVRTEDEIARYYWPKESQPSEQPAEWFRAAIRDAFDSGIAFAVRRGVSAVIAKAEGRS